MTITAVPTVSFSGIVGIESAAFVLSRGTTPSRGTVSTSIVAQSPPDIGDFVIDYDGTTLTIGDCAVVESTIDVGPAGFTLRIIFEDRRWRWALADGMIGLFNKRNDAATLATDELETLKFEATPQELIEMILERIGESDCDISELPNDARPFVDWTHTRPDLALADLLQQLGCDVVPDLDTGAFRVVRIGEGELLPALPTLEAPAYGLSNNDAAGRIRVLTGAVRWDLLFKMEAVGLETDGTWKKIDDLSYKPTDGWGLEDPDVFAGVTDVYDDESDGLEHEARDLALATVYRCFRVVEVAGGTGPDKLNPPGYEFAVDAGAPNLDSIEQLLPIYSDLNRVYKDDANGVQKPRRAQIFGEWNDGGNAELAFDNVEPGTLWKYGFSLDGEQGIVTLSTWAQKFDASAGTVAPARIYLRAACEASWPELNKKVYYGRHRDREDPEVDLTLVVNELHADIVPRITALYDASGDFGAPDIFEVQDNFEEVDEQCNYYLDALEWKIVDQESGVASYADLVLINPDGAIENVEFVYDAQGITTRVARFTRLAPYMPSWEESQYAANREAEAARAKSDRQTSFVASNGVRVWLPT